MSTYLYRAVNAEPVDEVVDYESDGTPYTLRHEVGEFTFGRQTGYLSRSGAVSAGNRSGYVFTVLRSEPVVFLTRAEKIQKRINELHAELAALAVES